MWATILGIISGFFEAVKLYFKINPPKTPEEKTKEGQEAIDEKMKSIEEDGRP